MICPRDRNIFVTSSRKACCRPRGEGPLYDFLYQVNLMIGDLKDLIRDDPATKAVLDILAGMKNIYIESAPSMGVDLVLP